jgi:hypothetical protein
MKKNMQQRSYTILKSLATLSAALLLLFTLPISTDAQLYDSVQRPRLQWNELHTQHFRILYHDGFEETARRAGRLMESQYSSIQELTGGNLNRFPVVINGYNDRANGYLTSFNYRVEVEAPPIHGKILNPRTGGWLENLMAHELVHALQFSVKGGYTSFVHLFSPDMGRSVHGFIPLGFIEGFAVYYETQLVPEQGGRGNFAPFARRFDANFSGPNRWSLAEMVTPPGPTRPGDRFYNAGYHLTSWLIDTHGQETIRNSLRSYARFPFLGYATQLWRHTGTSPRTMYRNFSVDMELRENERILSLQYQPFTPLDAVELGNLSGPDLHQPLWINETQILYYGRFYNAASGFWIYDTEDRTHHLFHETAIHESYRYEIDETGNNLIYSRYSPHRIHDNRSVTDIHLLNLSDGISTRISTGERFHTPSWSTETNAIHVLANKTYTSQWLKIYPDSIAVIADIHPHHIVQTAPNPVHHGLTAVVANMNGVQGLWFTHSGFEMDVLVQGPDIAFEGGSIYDVRWHTDGFRMVFTGERNGVMNIYEYDYAEDHLHQLTHTAYNAMEASYSPEGDRLALIYYEGVYRKMALIDRSDALFTEIDRIIWQPDLKHITHGPRLGDELMEDSKQWQTTSYRWDAGWIKPRSLFPSFGVISTNDKNYRFGLELHSSDVLRRNAYSLDFSYSKYYWYYDFQYRYTGIFPTVQLRTANMAYVPGISNPQQGFRYFGLERINSVSAPMTFRFDDARGSTALFISPEFRNLSTKIDARQNGESRILGTSDWVTSNRIRLTSVMNLSLRQNLRDAQPSGGFRLYAQGDYDLSNNGNRGLFKAARLGVQAYVAPLARWNQSLRVGAEVIRQNRLGYNLLGIVHEGFDVAGIGFPQDNLTLLSARYTIPLLFPEKGYYFIPVYMESVYGVLFSEVLGFGNFDDYQTLLGAGIRFRMKFVYNMTFDLGFGVAFLPQRNWEEAFVIQF